LKVIIDIHTKDGVLDPKSKSTLSALHSLGFNNANKVSIGKQIILEIDTKDKDKAKKEAYEMCNKLLVNNVIEDFNISL